MSFTYVLTTDIGKIRRDLSDKTPTDYHFSDEELQSFLDTEGAVDLATAAAFESWGAAYALNADNERIGDYSYAQSTSDKMLKMAASIRAAHAAIPSITWAEPDLLGTEEGDT